MMISPRHLAVVGSLLDFAGPRISQKFRRMLFRVCGAILAASFYYRVNGTPRFQSILGGLFAGLLFRYKAYGLENLPAPGFLLLSNHTCIFDAILLQLACPRPICLLANESVCRHPWLSPVLKLVGAEAIPTSERHAKEAIREAAKYIKNGRIVCVFPEGELSRSGTLLKLRRGFEVIARLAESELVPVWVDGLHDSIFSFERRKDFLKTPKRSTRRPTVAFGKSIPAHSADSGLVRQKLLELSEFCFQNRSELGVHLGRAAVKGLKSRPFDDAIVDGTNGQCVKRGNLLAICIAASRWIKRNCPGNRVALALAPGLGAVIANVAVTLANKVPVNFDIVAGRTPPYAASHRGQILSVISSTSVEMRPEDFPPPSVVYELENMMKELRPSIIFWRMVSLLLPARILSCLLGLPQTGDRKEAAICFTSNRSGEATGIVLSHRNVTGSVKQLDWMLKMKRKDALMATSSFFYGHDYTLTLWYPVIEGFRTVTQSNPVDSARNGELIEQYGITLLVTTPGFLRGDLARANAKQFENVKILITGSERLPSELGESFEQQFGNHVFPEYGLRETSSVVCMNLPDPLKFHPLDNAQPSNRAGSVGKLMPGQAAQIRHRVTGAVLSPYERGMLWLKGVNIFEGYFDDPKKAATVLRGGWFKTGEIAWFDEDGFLYLEGKRVVKKLRIRQFKKPKSWPPRRCANVRAVSDTGWKPMLQCRPAEPSLPGLDACPLLSKKRSQKGTDTKAFVSG